MEKLDIKEVQKLEDILCSQQNTAYWMDCIEIIKRWRINPDLEMNLETRTLIDQLFDEHVVATGQVLLCEFC